MLTYVNNETQNKPQVVNNTFIGNVKDFIDNLRRLEKQSLP